MVWLKVAGAVVVVLVGLSLIGTLVNILFFAALVALVAGVVTVVARVNGRQRLIRERKDAQRHDRTAARTAQRLHRDVTAELDQMKGEMGL